MLWPLKSLGLLIALATAAEAPQARSGEESSAEANLSARDDGDFEHTIIFGLGGATEVELQGGSLHPGVNAFIEYEAIPSWLELELSASVLHTESGREVSVDLLFKKPFRLGRQVELMVGLGPQIVWASESGQHNSSVGGELAVDLMFWPWRRFGFWLEPSYTLFFRDPVSHSLGATGGVLLGW